MRSDTPATSDLHYHTVAGYQKRWEEWLPVVKLSLKDDRNPEHIDGFKHRHYDRLLRLNQGLGIPMKIIRRYSMDDPRISEPEMMKRIHRYHVSREKVNPRKGKKGNYGN